MPRTMPPEVPFERVPFGPSWFRLKPDQLGKLTRFLCVNFCRKTDQIREVRCGYTHTALHGSSMKPIGAGWGPPFLVESGWSALERQNGINARSFSSDDRQLRVLISIIKQMAASRARDVTDFARKREAPCVG